VKSLESIRFDVIEAVEGKPGDPLGASIVRLYSTRR
jgi:hypothetical protein